MSCGRDRRVRRIHRACRWQPSSSSTLSLTVAIICFASSVHVEAAAQTDLLEGSIESWRVVRDRPNGGDAPRLTQTDDGLGVVTGAASVLFNPAATGEGDFAINAEIQLFDPQRRNEGFGVFFGGRAMLSAPERAYSYFLIRQDGSALLKVREGAETRIVQDWESAQALRGWAMRSPDNDFVTNSLRIEVNGDSVRVLANGSELWRVPRNVLPVDGVIGLRVNHGLRIRVVELDVERRTANGEHRTSNIEH